MIDPTDPFVRVDPLRPRCFDPRPLPDQVWRVRWRRPAWAQGRYGISLHPSLSTAITAVLVQRERPVLDAGPMQTEVSQLRPDGSWQVLDSNVDPLPVPAVTP